MGFDITDYKKSTLIQVLKAYLYDEKSHRHIQENILKVPAPARGGGFMAMQILHYFEIDGPKKGILNRVSLKEELLKAAGRYKMALELLEDAVG